MVESWSGPRVEPFRNHGLLSPTPEGPSPQSPISHRSPARAHHPSRIHVGHVSPSSLASSTRQGNSGVASGSVSSPPTSPPRHTTLSSADSECERGLKIWKPGPLVFISVTRPHLFHTHERRRRTNAWRAVAARRPKSPVHPSLALPPVHRGPAARARNRDGGPRLVRRRGSTTLPPLQKGGWVKTQGGGGSAREIESGVGRSGSGACSRGAPRASRTCAPSASSGHGSNHSSRAAGEGSGGKGRKRVHPTEENRPRQGPSKGSHGV